MNELAGDELPHWSFHDLRRTCETGMAMLGIDQNTIDRCTNHLSGRFMSRVYNQYEYQSQKTEAWQRWADHVKGLVSLKTPLMMNCFVFMKVSKEQMKCLY